MKLKQGLIGALWLVFALACFAAPQAQADDTSANISIGKAISNLKISGDFRLRQEFFWNTSNSNTKTPARPDPYTPDRSRQRFRFRLGISPQIQDITLFFRLASGTGEQVSTNQTFDNGFTLKKIWIDQAALQWKAFEWFKLTGGRMPNPIWRTYASDITWDDDLSPEGFAEQFDKNLGERFGVFANFGQFPLDEDSANNFDQWVFANQIGVRTKIMEETKFTIAGNFNYFKDEARGDWGLAVANPAVGAALPDITGGAVQNNTGGNGRVNALGQLASSFTVVGITAEMATRVWRWPVLIHADYMINMMDNSSLNRRTDLTGYVPSVSGDSQSEAKVGYQLGFQLNKAALAKSWELAYYYKYIENNATPSDFADSDWGNGGTNRKGHIFWLAYAPRDYVTLKVKLFSTEILNTAFNVPAGAANGFGNSINRLQIDLAVKF